MNFDELQSETEKLLALLKDRQPGIAMRVVVVSRGVPNVN